MREPVTVIGAGLAGCEAAWQLAQAGHPRGAAGDEAPEKDPRPPCRPGLGSWCCSNSLRSDQLENAVGLLKEELRRLGSLILRCADEHRVAAGGALAVDRDGLRPGCHRRGPKPSPHHRGGGGGHRPAGDRAGHRGHRPPHRRRPGRGHCPALSGAAQPCTSTTRRPPW